MKRIIIMMLVLALAFTFESCGSKETKEDENGMLLGGWTEKDEELNEEELAIFYDATQYISDVSLEPIKLIGTQVVAGLNYKFLCIATDEAGEHKVVVTVYHDLQGNNTVTYTENYTE